MNKRGEGRKGFGTPSTTEMESIRFEQNANQSHRVMFF